MLANTIARDYHCRMSKYVRLKNGLEVPKSTLMKNAQDIYSKFDGPIWSPLSMPEILFRMVLTLQSNMTDVRLSRYEIGVLEMPMHDFHIGGLRQRNNSLAMARSALALNMIVVSESDGDIEGYLDEPVGPHMQIMPALYKEKETRESTYEYDYYMTALPALPNASILASTTAWTA